MQTQAAVLRFRNHLCSVATVPIMSENTVLTILIRVKWNGGAFLISNTKDDGNMIIHVSFMFLLDQTKKMRLCYFLCWSV